jgi:fluoride exporter
MARNPHHETDTDTEAAIDGNHELPIDPDLGIESADGTPDGTRVHATGHSTGRARHLRILAAIALGGFAGGLARYGIGRAAPTPHGAFPATTFGINVAGSFILALLVVFVLEILPPTVYLRPLLGVGFCGALTTFSTWMVDIDRLVAAGRDAAAAGDLFGSLAAGLAATSLGLTIGRAIVGHRERVRGEDRDRDHEHERDHEVAVDTA